MKIRPFLHRLLQNHEGNTIVEFAIAGPIFIGFLIGVFQAGVQVQNYNALRSASFDASRYVVVEYQKGNRLTTEQIHVRAASIAVQAPYLLDSENLDVNVAQPSSRVTGANEISLTLHYNLPNWLQLLGIGQTRMTYSRSIFVPATV